MNGVLFGEMVAEPMRESIGELADGNVVGSFAGRRDRGDGCGA
jgi:hypothetical protein